MLTTVLVVLALAGGGQPPRPRPSQPPPPPPDLAVMVERVVRLTDLQRQKLELERELAALTVGAQHPARLKVVSDIALIEAAIRRENYRSYQSDAQALQEERARVESELSKLGRTYGSAHPSILAAQAQLRHLIERQRQMATDQLGGGLEAQLRASIATHPTSPAAYLELAGLYLAAGRKADAEQVLADLLAAIKAPGHP